MIHEKQTEREALKYIEGFIATCKCKSNNEKRHALVAMLRTATDEISRLSDFSEADRTATVPVNGLIRMPDVERLTGLARATIYKRLKNDPSFHRPVPLSCSKGRGAPIGFRFEEVQSWINTRGK